MSYVPIYLPDGSLGVEWYVSEPVEIRGGGSSTGGRR